jgi:hypothetical protein
MLFTLLLSAVICLSPFQANEVQSFEVQPDKPLGDVVSIEEALSEFEARYEKKVMIPNYVPFDPTISGGKVEK